MSSGQQLKSAVYRVLGLDPVAVVVCLCPGPRQACESMLREVQALTPEYRHIAFRLATEEPLATECTVITIRPERPLLPQIRHELRGLRIGLLPVRWLPQHPLCRVAWRLAPTKILAFNAQGERYHLQWQRPVSSWLFARGVELDRIHLRPRWLAPWKADRSRWPDRFREAEARGPRPGKPRVAVFTPYSPWPLSHGGAVRMFALLREAAIEFDIYLFWFSEGEDPGPLRDFCAGLYCCELPRFREPRWSTLVPPAVGEFWSAPLAEDFDRICRAEDVKLRQIEYTQLARYAGDILVEHDVTFDLFAQIQQREPSRSHWWDWTRWRNFEQRAVLRFRRVVVMSENDAASLPQAHTAVIPNGVDLERFQPAPESELPSLLFIGSFRHFPNIAAYTYFVQHIWPLVKAAVPGVRLTVVGGPDPLLYWRAHTGTAAPEPDLQIECLGYVADVRPLYVQTQVVLVPTTVSAGTNLKVLEAMAMQRAVVSTTSGCAGLDVVSGQQLLIADEPESFAHAVVSLLGDKELRAELAKHGRQHVEARFGWQELGRRQRQLWTELL